MEKRIAITGHRPNKLGNDYELKSPLVKWIRTGILQILETEKPTQLISGMALGIDTLFALIGLELQIPVLAAVPFEGQEKIWPATSQQIYNMILRNPLVTKKIICPGGYAGWKMIKRDEWMVDNSDLLIAVYNGSGGGTGHTFDYANEVGRRTIRINPKDFNENSL